MLESRHAILNRRAALTALAAGPALALLPAIALEHAPDAMAEAVALHRVAWDALGEACTVTDEVLAEREGRTITEADESAHNTASEAEQASRDRILASAISSLAEMRVFADWAAWIYDGAGDLDLPDRLRETLRRAPILAGRDGGRHVA